MINKFSQLSLWLICFMVTLFLQNNLFASTLLPEKNPTKIQSDNHLVVVKNHKLIFDIIKKPKASEDVILLNRPTHGRVFVNSVDSMTYVPQADICEQNDHFSYLLKMETGYDTIDVTVEILCETLTIVSGFSPDGDGVNDHFTILGIQNFPNNSILIFNKWGEQIYQEKGYNNSWGGENDHSNSLPTEENLYYYVFNDGKGKSYSGYVKIIDHI